MEQTSLLTEQELAAILNINVSFLRRDRVARNLQAGTCRFRFIKIGTMIRYDPETIKIDLAKAAATAMVAPQPKPPAAPKPVPDGQQEPRGRGRPKGSTKAKKLAEREMAERSEAQNG